MEADWQEIARIPNPPPSIHPASTPVTSFVFDSSQELLWSGNGYGRVTSFYGAQLVRYTSWVGHAPQEGAIKQILVCENGVISTSARSVHLSSRCGRALWHLKHDDFADLRCMCFLGRGDVQLLVGGCQDKMFKIDVEKGEVIQTIPAADQYTIMKRGGPYICAATFTGSVHLLDFKTLEVVKNWKAHQGWINDMDANNGVLVTCGWSPRQQYGNLLDPLAKVFDLRTLMPLPPVSFHAGAGFVKLHPRMGTTATIASPTGQLQVVDIVNNTMVNLRQLHLSDSLLLSLEIAPSGEALVFTDSACTIQLWGSPSRLRFLDYSTPTEFADNVVQHHYNMNWSGYEPLNGVGMPYYREPLLSAWPGHLIFHVGSLPGPLDPSISSALTRTEFGAYAPNTSRIRRNQASDARTAEKAMAAIEGPKFLSERAKDGGKEGNARRMSEVVEAFNASTLSGNIKSEVPIIYRNVEIKYSKFGIEDFDFGFYNTTRFSGLETHIVNSYTNALLQLLKFIPCIRNLALHHTSTPCLFETCLLCEMGFLFDMLEKASGQNCQATNFLRTFSSLSHAASLGLLEENNMTRPLTVMIQATTRFLLEKITADYRQMARQSSQVDQILTTVAMNSIRCAHCANETVRPGGTYVHELVYPPRTPTKTPGRAYAPSFSQILKASVERQDQTRGWCDRCKRYQQLSGRKTIQSLPPVLVLNAAIQTMDAEQLWSNPGWLPQEIGIVVDQGQFFCYEGPDLQFHLQRGAFKIIVYELIGFVADIVSGERQHSHLVSMINVCPSLPEVDSKNQWHIFNDFLVRDVSDAEALRFDASWKLPSVLAYQVKSARHRIDDSWKNSLDTSLLYRKWSLQENGDLAQVRFLSYPSERPVAGTLVGIDAEFVALQQEELEVKIDGTRSTVRPTRMGLARVSILRGGPPTVASAAGCSSDGYVETTTADETDYIPFIDDYIQISEPVVDYLTQYSGIHPGDLDPNISPYLASGRLVSLKTAYKKIWLLLNLGCIFVGHGLLKDFRTINIHVPKTQVIDTVDIYFIKKFSRKLSLKFLSWIILGERVQRGNHDSIEDARMALKLWRAWQQYENEGREQDVLQEIYSRGRDTQFKVPSSPGEPEDMSMLQVDGRTSRGLSPAASIRTGDGSPEKKELNASQGRSAGLVSVREALVEEGKRE